MSKTPQYDKKIKIILDQIKPGSRICERTEETWYMDEEEISWFKAFQVPPSRVSKKMRMWQLSCFFVVYQWWWNKHFDTGEPILTSAHPASGIRVLPDKEWFERDFSEKGREIDLTRPFFDQFRALQLEVPINATRNGVPPENSITLFSLGDQNSYFVAASKSKNSLYLNDCDGAENCMLGLDGIHVSESYFFAHSARLHHCLFALQSFDCVNSLFLFDCRNCEYCFGATNKRNRKYIWWNEQLSKEEWERRMVQIDLGSYLKFSQIYNQFIEFIHKQAIWPENFTERTTDSTGEYLFNSSSSVHTSYGRFSHHNYYCYGVWQAKDNAFSCAVPGERNYLSGPVSQGSNCKFSPVLVRCDECEYCFNCYDCTHCFGCVGLHRKQFCLLNKQYTEDEYWKKIDELKCVMLDRGEYGQALPGEFSFSYFPEGGPVMYLGAELSDWQTIGMQQFSIDADGAFGEMRLEGKEITPLEDIPDHINEVDVEIWSKKIFIDSQIKRPFTYLKPEIEFCKKYRLPLSRKHFTRQMKELFFLMNTGLFVDTVCTVCKKQITVAQNRTFQDRRIYCHQCYLNYLEQNG